MGAGTSWRRIVRTRMSTWMLCLLASTVAGAETAPKPGSHTARVVEGWTVQVDNRLLDGEAAELGQRSLRLLGDRLYEITLVMPEDKVDRLRKVPIWLDLTHGGLTSMQYHPSAGWLRGNGYPEELEKCVHIPDAAGFANPKHHHQQPWAVLHELAHAYHDQVLDFEHAEIKAAWERIREGGRYEKVLHIDGRSTKHYALTNQKEFFAEMTEAYFGLNDFYPFHRAELQRDEPELYELLKKVWGPVPRERVAVEKRQDQNADAERYEVVLVAAGAKTLSVISALRMATGLRLREAKDLVEGAPKPVASGVSKAEAERIKKALEAPGAEVQIRSAKPSLEAAGPTE